MSELQVKNKLPKELRERLQTKNQWLKQGKCPLEGAEAIELYANSRGTKTFEYYLDMQVEPLRDDMQLCCTCSYRKGNYCPIAGEKVSMDNRCSEWTQRG